MTKAEELASLKAQYRKLQDSMVFIPQVVRKPGQSIWCCGQEIPNTITRDELTATISRLHAEQRQQT